MHTPSNGKLQCYYCFPPFLSLPQWWANLVAHLDAARAVISHSEMKEGYGNVCDEPGETWPGLASTFTQKRINLFNHPELPLCIPDEDSEPVCACWVLPVICKSLNTLEKVVGKSRGDILTATWWLALTWARCKNSLITLPPVFSPPVILISSGTQSTRTTLYLSNKAAICMFAVPNKGFRNEICMRNLWTEIWPLSKWIRGRYLTQSVTSSEMSK